MKRRSMLQGIAVAVLAPLVVAMVAGPVSAASIRVHPTSGQPGTSVIVRGTGFIPGGGGRCSGVSVKLRDADHVSSPKEHVDPRPDGTFRIHFVVPAGAANGPGWMWAFQMLGRTPRSGCLHDGPVRAPFTVTSASPTPGAGPDRASAFWDTCGSLAVSRHCSCTEAFQSKAARGFSVTPTARAPGRT